MRYIGVHVSIAGGVTQSFKRAHDLNVNAMQIFLKNCNRWESPPYSEGLVDDFHFLRECFPEQAIYAHGGYLINLAGYGENLTKSLNAMIDEIHRAEALGIDSLVIHPGYHKGSGAARGIQRIAQSLDYIYQRSESTVNILLETTSGMGTSLGYCFEHLRDIISHTRYPEKVYICLDTCHVFAAGYDISDQEGLNDTMISFDRIVGLDRLRLIHLNDSKRELASRIDRHEHIGEGCIGYYGFKCILNDKRLLSIPMVLETPKENGNSDRMNLKRIYRLIDN